MKVAFFVEALITSQESVGFHQAREAWVPLPQGLPRFPGRASASWSLGGERNVEPGAERPPSGPRAYAFTSGSNSAIRASAPT